MKLKDFRKALPVQSKLSFYNRQGGRVTYTILKEIGRGSSCIVYDAYYETNAGDYKYVRMKECYPYKLEIERNGDGLLIPSSQCKEAFQAYQNKMVEDFRLSNQLFHAQGLNDSITNSLDIYDGNQTKYVISTYLKENTLSKYQPDSLKSCIHIVLQVAKAIQSIHSAGYLYLDTKPDNILIVEGEHERIRLFDFDSLVPIDLLKQSYLLRISYSHGYAPIELKMGDNEHLGFYSDVYSIGALLFYLLFQRTPNAKDCENYAKYDYSSMKYHKGVYRHKLYAALDTFFHQTLADYYLDRYQVMDAAIEQLEQILKYTSICKEYLLSSQVMNVPLLLGRKQELASLNQWLCDKQSLCYVYGMGGIGKSSLVKTFCFQHRHQFDDFLYLYYEGSLKQMLVKDDIVCLSSVQRHVSESYEEYYQRKLLALRHYLQEHQVLVVVDNFEFQANDEWVEFTQLGWNVIVVSREEPPFMLSHCLEVRPLQDERDCSTIFSYALGHHLNEEELLFLKSLNGHPLLIEFMGKQLAYLKDDGYELIKESLFIESQDKIWYQKDKQIYYDSIHHVLSKLFVSNKLSDEQQMVLKLIWIYGKAEIQEHYFKLLNQNVAQKTFIELNRLGWIQLRQGIISMHPLIQEVVKKYTWTPLGLNMYDAFLKQIHAHLNQNTLNVLPSLEGMAHKLKMTMKQQMYISVLEQYSRVEKKEYSEWLIDELHDLLPFFQRYSKQSAYYFYQFMVEYYLSLYDFETSLYIIQQAKPKLNWKIDYYRNAYYQFLWVVYYDARNEEQDPFLYLKHLDKCMKYLKHCHSKECEAWMMNCYASKLIMLIRTGLAKSKQIQKTLMQYRNLIQKSEKDSEQRFGYYITLAWYYSEVEMNQKAMRKYVEKAYCVACKCFTSQLDLIDMIYIPVAQMLLDMNELFLSLKWLQKAEHILKEQLHLAPFIRKLHDIHQYMIEVYLELNDEQQAMNLLNQYDDEISIYGQLNLTNQISEDIRDFLERGGSE